MWYKNRIQLPLETIYEIVTSKDAAGFGHAIADIVRSEPHYHQKTLEVYALIWGSLQVHVGEHIVTLSESGERNVVIPIGTVHWAQCLEGEPARISVITIPAWTPEDHIVINKK